MKIKANIPTEIVLSKEQQKKIALDYLYNLYEWKSSYFISDQCLYKTVIYHQHETWEEDLVVRDATDDDYVMASLLLKIKESN